MFDTIYPVPRWDLPKIFVKISPCEINWPIHTYRIKQMYAIFLAALTITPSSHTHNMKSNALHQFKLTEDQRSQWMRPTQMRHCPFIQLNFTILSPICISISIRFPPLLFPPCPLTSFPPSRSPPQWSTLLRRQLKEEAAMADKKKPEPVRPFDHWSLNPASSCSHKWSDLWYSP